jgi:Co/Zn/Cd efflux system component
MHTENLSKWIHDHVFNESSLVAERSTRAVMWITAAMMVIEIAAGWWYNSMALLADGWHMSSHAVAIGLSTMAYAAARKAAHVAATHCVPGGGRGGGSRVAGQYGLRVDSGQGA